jgi:FkbM family methyltransferase
VGANIGLYTVPASIQIATSGLVVCFEAHLFDCRFLRHNMARSCTGDVITENLAVGSESGSTRIAFSSANPGETPVARPDEIGDAARIVSLDDYCARSGIDRIDYLKIDVEGHEINVLRGAREIIGDNSGEQEYANPNRI